MQAEQQSERKRQAAITKVYDKLHEGKLGAHWLWCVIEQMAAGVSEEEAMRDYGYYTRAALSHPSPAQGWQPMDDGTMKTIMVQLGAKEVTNEGVVFFRKIEDAVLKVLSARAAGYPAGDGWASAPPPVVQGDKT